MEATHQKPPQHPADQFVRLPGLFRRWELEHAVGDDVEFFFEAAGRADDGTSLFAIYCRPRAGKDQTT